MFKRSSLRCKNSLRRQRRSKMFEKFKEKLKSFIKRTSKEVEEQAAEAPEEEEIIEEVKEAPKPKKKPKKKKVEKELVEEKIEEEEEVVEKEPEEEELEPEKEGEEEKEEEIEEPEVEEELEEDIKEPEEEEAEEPEKVEEEPEVVEEPPKPEKKSFFKKIREKIISEKKEEPKKEEELKEEVSILKKLTGKVISEKKLEPLLWELELLLIENDVAKEVAEEITASLKENLAGKAVRGSTEETVQNELRKVLAGLLDKPQVVIPDLVKAKKKAGEPFVIVFFGFNGTGKTISIAKLGKILKDKGFSVVVAAGDTFRAAAIEQLSEYAEMVGIPVIKQAQGSDSAAVTYDAIKHAKAKGVDVVIADTAGRIGSDQNLMDELRKVVRVSNPDLKIFVGDSLAGNDAAEQAKNFDDAVGIDASILTKVDCDPKGGACISIVKVTDAPIVYLGTGQEMDALTEFTPEWFLDRVF